MDDTRCHYIRFQGAMVETLRAQMNTDAYYRGKYELVLDIARNEVAKPYDEGIVWPQLLTEFMTLATIGYYNIFRGDLASLPSPHQRPDEGSEARMKSLVTYVRTLPVGSKNLAPQIRLLEAVSSVIVESRDGEPPVFVADTKAIMEMFPDDSAKISDALLWNARSLIREENARFKSVALRDIMGFLSASSGYNYVSPVAGQDTPEPRPLIMRYMTVIQHHTTAVAKYVNERRAIKDVNAVSPEWVVEKLEGAMLLVLLAGFFVINMTRATDHFFAD